MTAPARSPWLGLAALCLPMLIVSMDVSVLFFAVPFISADLNPTAAQQLWIFDVYGFVLAGLLLSMGAVADRVGHRRLLVIGATGFGIASVLAAYAGSAEMLIAARALLAVAGATLMPSTLALVRHLFVDEKARTKAVAIWTAVMTGGVAVGPIISGALLEHFWWGSVFLVNLPVMIMLLVAAPILLPARTGDRARRIDLWSSVLALAAILPVVEGIKTFASDGWAWWRPLILTAGVLAGWLFVRRQRRVSQPLVDLSLLTDRRSAAPVWINLIAMFGILGNAIIMTQYLQSVLGFSPLTAALWSLLPSVFIAFVAPLAATLCPLVGRPAVMIGGLLIATGGFVVLAGFATTNSLVVVLTGATLLSSGLVATSTMVYDHVIGAAPTERAGAVAGLLETTSELGGALGIVALGSVVNALYRNTFDYPGAVGEEARAGLSGAVATGRAGVVEAGRVAYVHGLVGAASLGAAVLACTAVIGAWLLRSSAPRSERESVHAS